MEIFSTLLRSSSYFFSHSCMSYFLLLRGGFLHLMLIFVLVMLYRDSKLTRILKDSLGGTAVTLMIAAISPSNVSLLFLIFVSFNHFL